jgi:hypothetical protein
MCSVLFLLARAASVVLENLNREGKRLFSNDLTTLSSLLFGPKGRGAHVSGSAGQFNLSAFTYVQNGTVLISDASATGGAYQINSDCSGSIQISTTGGTFRFAILITGKKASQFQMLETDGTATTSGNAVMQSLEPKDPR